MCLCSVSFHVWPNRGLFAQFMNNNNARNADVAKAIVKGLITVFDAISVDE